QRTGRPIPGWDGCAAGRIVDELVRRFAPGSIRGVPLSVESSSAALLQALDSPGQARSDAS
ncbi:MAG TPA: hypothetical protein VEQ10_07760, partial [Vicinamibacteria bacterium]|nr:hypothetical protein [Vicinamibacteria bacterium]